jgi:hypothetical protein
VLDSAVYFLANEVNAYLKRLAVDVVSVVPGGLANDNGTWAIPDNTIGLAVVNVEEERTLRTQTPERILVNGNHVVLPAELKLNLNVVFAVRHAKYDHTLRYLSHVLRFFQTHPTFVPTEYPALDPSIGKLNVELVTYGPEQLNQLWAYIGTKYLPSAVYRVRMLVLRDAEPTGVDAPVTEIDARVSTR